MHVLVIIVNMDLCSFVFFTLHILKSCEVLGSHSGTDQNASLLGCYVESTDKTSPTFRRVVATSSSIRLFYLEDTLRHGLL